jgi:hypothetical protein
MLASSSEAFQRARGWSVNFSPLLVMHGNINKAIYS